MAKQTFTTGQVLTAAQMTNLQQTAMGGGTAVVKTASYVLVAADAGTVIQMNSASSTTITVNTALFAAGDSVFIQNIGAGTCTITAGTATVNTAGSLALTQWEGGQLFFNSTSASVFFDYYQAGGGGGGKVLQVVMGTTTTTASSATTTFVDTNLTASITPSASTSKVLVLVSQNGIFDSISDGGMGLKLFRGASEIAMFGYRIGRDNALNTQSATGAIAYLDSPATTSSTTYKTQFNSQQGVSACQVQYNNELSTIILLEIGA